MTATTPNRSQSDNSTSRREEEQAPDLEPEEEAVLRYVRSNESTTQEMLAYRAGLPESRVNAILRTLASYGLVDVEPSFIAVHVSASGRGDADA